MSGSFEIPACGQCGHAVWPPRLACSVCGSAQWESVDASIGSLEELTELPREGQGPVRLCSVRLDAGPIVVARCEERGAAGDRVNMALRGKALWATPV